VIGRKHQDFVEEMAAVVGETALEPQQTDNTTETHVTGQNFANLNAVVMKLITTLVRDTGKEIGRLTDDTQLLGPGVVQRHLRDFRLGHLDNDTFFDKTMILILNGIRHLVERLRHDDSRGFHGSILGHGGFHVTTGLGAGMAELHIERELSGAGTDTPCNYGLLDKTLLDRVDDFVFINTTNLTQQQKHLDVRVGFITQHVVDEAGTRVTITADSHTFIHTIRITSNHVVQFVGHTTRFGDVGDGTRAVQTRHNDVVKHTTGVTNTEDTSLDTTNSSGADNGDALVLRLFQDETGLTFWYTFGDDGHGLDARGVLQAVHGGFVGGTEGREIDHAFDVGALSVSLLDASVDRD